MESSGSRGFIQVYTGNGKGKTTAALGLALRSAGRGWNVFIGQFLKGQAYGELISLERLSPLVKIEQFGRKGFVHVTENPDDEDVRLAREGLRRCAEAMASGNFRLMILDEINVALHFKLITEAEMRAFLGRKPESVEVVLTGRYAPDWLIEAAGLVTEMIEVKHPFRKGVKAREGIEK
ncbi:MAG: cob(I)yrinic acid a,c-diamide adenosyltransferase [Candidatus Aminicenantes bacterium RBG_13_59_9]|nr:MAG: cob(I)yrinic acid a,c-diamide adenosyltransferase [Candidatus Aminicenantes bacterium RBG_13_59_9]